MLMKHLALCSTLTLVVTAHVSAQNLDDARQRFNAGKYRDAIEAVDGPQTEDGGGGKLRLLYLKALSLEKLNEPEDAIRVYSQLSSVAEPASASIAESAIHLVRKEPREALESASHAVEQNPELAEAHYQLGLAASFNQDFAKAASAFDKAAQLDPQWAYARYYAGLSYYKARRIDLLSSRFEAFLKLAPQAPERPEVESIMRTIRGR